MDIPAPIQPLLDDYIDLLESHFAEEIYGVYLHGSLALGAFDPAHSDIDFLTILKQPSTPADYAKINAIHRQLAKDYPQWQLDGDYLPVQDIGKSPAEIQAHPRFNGELNPNGEFDGGWVTWWILKNHGIALLGPDPQTLKIEINWDSLLNAMHMNLNTYWRRFTRNPRRISWLFTDDGIAWTVLGVLRLFYTFAEHTITSKVGAGEYGLQELPARWHRIIQEAISIRQSGLDNNNSLYKSRIQRFWSAFRFLNHTINLCNQRYAQNTAE